MEPPRTSCSLVRLHPWTRSSLRWMSRSQTWLSKYSFPACQSKVWPPPGERCQILYQKSGEADKEGLLKDIVGYNEDLVISCEFNWHSTTFGHCIKLIYWYDNEFNYNNSSPRRKNPGLPSSERTQKKENGQLLGGCTATHPLNILGHSHHSFHSRYPEEGEENKEPYFARYHQ